MITKSAFNKTIYDYYATYGRRLPWRYEQDPYKVFVSEVMLQQTQVSRVLIKYPQFIKRFPTFESLAKAKLKDILLVWQGMGYNRRAKYLLESARVLTRDKRYTFLFHKNLKGSRTLKVEHAQEMLKSLPGVGEATAGAILTYAFNIPTVFIETNIRSVFLYFFFKGKTHISDQEIFPLVHQALDRHHPREWYYAVTDYAVMLKKQGFSNTISKQYHKQKKFKGSVRKVRGEILRELLKSPQTKNELAYLVSEPKNLYPAIEGLKKEKMVKFVNNKYLIR